jgi:transcriptional regulator with PAS, ATPase and Fis domain
VAITESTIDFAGRESRANSAAAPELVLALMIAWSPAAPERVGEVAIFDADSGARVLGRGAPETGGNERAVFYRQRPERLEGQPPLSSPGLSREQLRIRVDRGGLRVEQIGKGILEFEGKRVDQCVVAPGQSILLKGQLLLYCTLRPRWFDKLRAAKVEANHAFGAPDDFGIVGESVVAWKLRDQLSWLGKADGHTLLLGGSGSGKELCARAVHIASKRAKGPFVARNAATIPDGIIDAELFGNVKNYPNPGMLERPGLIGAAHGGTLFLDEIGELPQNLQANLLRVLDEDGEYHNLGGTVAKRANFRLLGATNRDPNSLKHDLAARLVLRAVVPGLNDRRDDIPLLVRHLLKRALAKSPEAVEGFFTTVNGSSEPNLRPNFIENLINHSYTTNVRELDALLWRAMSSSSGNTLEWPNEVPVPSGQVVGSIPLELQHVPEVEAPTEIGRDPTEEEIRASLAEHNGNIVRVAKALGLSSRYVLYRFMRKYGINVS